MKTKKKGVLILSVIIVALAVIAVLFSPRIKDGIDSLAVKRVTGEDLDSVDSIHLIAECSEIDSITDSVAGVKEAVRLGADGVIVDICFTDKNIPILSDKYSPDKEFPTVESLFAAMQEEKYEDIAIYLNIVQLSDMSVLNELAVKYNMNSRVYLVGIDADHYGMITSDDTIIPFFLDYTLTDADIKSIDAGTFAAPQAVTQYGAHGIVIAPEQANEKNISALNDYGVPFIVAKTETGKQMCDILLNGAQNIVVENIKKSSEILDGWVSEIQQRFEISVQKSLEDLSRKTK